MERLLTIGLIVGIPFVVVCILCVICHGNSPFIFMNHDKKLPDIRTLNDKYEKVSAKRKHKAWLRISSKIVYAAKHGNKHAQIWPEDYIAIPYEEFKGELESRGYVLEAHSKTWYRERLSIDISWEDK